MTRTFACSLVSRMALAVACSSVPAGVAAEVVLPQGGAVVAGAATIHQSAPGTVQISQNSLRAVIDWNSFSIGENGLVQFNNGSGATLNRVLGGDPSSIAGRLMASGSVYLLNPAGVLVGPNGSVQVGGSFVAAGGAADIATFLRDGQVDLGAAPVIRNSGRISAGGDVVLVGQLIENTGGITSGGTATLAAAARVMLREAAGDGRVHIEYLAGSETKITNTGSIEAANVELRSVGGNVYALAADTGGIIRATGVKEDAGRVLLVGSNGVTIGGSIEAAGGSIDVAGQAIHILSSGRITAANAQGNGGSIRVGGDLKGGSFVVGSETLAPASSVLIDAGGTIDVSGRRGGQVVVWSEDVTRFEGLIKANGVEGGGFVETSSRGDLGIDLGRVEVGNGTWLLDPRNVEIVASGGTDPSIPPTTVNPPVGAGPYRINRAAITSALDAGSNVIVTTDAAGTDVGNITLVSGADLAWTGGGTLTLTAANDIILNASIQLGGAGGLSLLANRDITVASTLSTTDIATGSASLIAGRSIALNANVTFRNTSSFEAIANGTLIDGVPVGIIIGGNSGNRRIETAQGSLSLQATSADVLIGREAVASNSNVQVLTGGGALNLTAGRDVIIFGGPQAGAGRWTRVGSSAVAAPITILAGRNAAVNARSNNFAQLVTAGAISVTAGNQIRLQSTTQAAGSIQGLGPSLALSAPNVTINGALTSRGDTLLTGNGSYTINVSPDFNLDAGRSFTLASGSEIKASTGIVINTSGTGDVNLLGLVTGTSLLAVAGDQFTVGAPISMAGGQLGVEPLVLVAGTQFNNVSGLANVLSTASGRWLTYSVSPLTDLANGPLFGSVEPSVYGSTFAGNPPSTFAGQSRRIYGFQPTLVLTADSGSKIYGQGNPGLGFSFSGLMPGDTLGSALSGAPTVDSLGFATTANVGTYSVDVFATASAQNYAISLVSGSLRVNPATLSVVADAQTKVYGTADPTLTFTANGFQGSDGLSLLTGNLARVAGETVLGGPYAITLGSLDAGGNYTIEFTGNVLSITPAILNAILTGNVSKVYDANTIATLGAGNLELAGLVGTDAVTISATSAAFDTANVGTGKLITANGLAISGADASNYILANTSISNTIGTITPAALSVVALDASRPVNTANPLFQLQATGLQGGDTLSGIGISASTLANLTSPPGAYAIDILGNPLNYTLTRLPGVLTVVGLAPPPPPPLAPGAQFVEQRIVPILGGLVQMGAATGLNNMLDTLGNGPVIGGSIDQALLWRSRYGIWAVQTPAGTDRLGGSSGFER